MQTGSNQPQNPGGGGRGRRRRRARRGGSGRPGQGPQPHSRPQGGGQHKGGGQRRGQNAFTGPMDHSYRANLENGNGADGNLVRPTYPMRAQQRGGFVSGEGELQPLAARPDDMTRIFAFVDDLFFVAKINEISRKLNIKVEFVKSEKDLTEKVEAQAAGAEGEAVEAPANGYKPSLIIFDLNSNSTKPLTIIPKLKSRFKKETSIVGFVSHVQGDLKLKAQEAGCDMVVPRSAFSQNLPNLLRRHGAPEEMLD